MRDYSIVSVFRALKVVAAFFALAMASKGVFAQQGDAKQEDQSVLFDKINLAEAWSLTKGDPNVVVGVIDNGFDFFHPDLKGQIVPGYYYSDAFHTEFWENMAHGTWVSSIIVAKDNNIGMVGLAPHCKVLTCSQGTLEHKLIQLQQDFFRKHPSATPSEWQQEIVKHSEELGSWGDAWVKYQSHGAAQAIRYLVDRKVRVINISAFLEKSSFKSEEVWDELQSAFAYAAERGVVVVIAAGNNALNVDQYPGKSESMIVVGAVANDDKRWEVEQEMSGTKIKAGSNYGKRLTVMAPVEQLVVCDPHDKRFYETIAGPWGPYKTHFSKAYRTLPNGATSSAAPIVTSLVALILSINRDLDAASVVKIVQQGCDDLGDPGQDIQTGFGRVNFGKTLRLAKNWKGQAEATRP